MHSKKILILMAIDNVVESPLTEKYLSNMDTVERAPIFKTKNHRFMRAIRRLWLNLKIPGYQLWAGDWWKHVSDYDIIIAIANKPAYRLFEIMKRQYPQIRKIIYFMDPVRKSTLDASIIDDTVCEKWSFCASDARKFGMHYNPTFLMLSPNRIGINEIYDLMFVGSCGGKIYSERIPTLQKLFEICEKSCLKTSFHVWYSSKWKHNQPFQMDKQFSQVEYYRLVTESKALVDIVESAKPWITLRPLEALYFHKKLISNNMDLLEEPLYHPNNVFLLGKDNLDDLKNFLDKPLVKLGGRYTNIIRWKHGWSDLRRKMQLINIRFCSRRNIANENF